MTDLEAADPGSQGRLYNQPRPLNPLTRQKNKNYI